MSLLDSPQGQRGSVTVLAAGVLVLAGVLTLAAVDLLRAVQARAVAQTAADAAALAAAQEIAIPSGRSPQDVAAEYARLNEAVLITCACDPGSTEAVVEVEAMVDLVFVGRDRTVRARARAVIEAAKSDGASTMAADADSETNPIGGPQAFLERQRQWPRSTSWLDGRRGLHARQASPPQGVAPRRPVALGDLRRAPRAPPRRPLPWR